MLLVAWTKATVKGKLLMQEEAGQDQVNNVTRNAMARLALLGGNTDREDSAPPCTGGSASLAGQVCFLQGFRLESYDI